MSRKIPKVASASLVLGAMGCNSTGNSNAAGAAKLACEHKQYCFPSTFSADYSSLSQCASALQSSLSKYSSACAKAKVDFYKCYYEHLGTGKNSCSTYAEGTAATACAGFYNTEMKTCP